MGKKRPRSEGKQSHRARKAAHATGGIHVTTPKGDELVVATVRYRHNVPREIHDILRETEDFELEAGTEKASQQETGSGESWDFGWLETERRAPNVPAPIGRRVLGSVTLTPTTLEAETMSERRLDRCHVRLEELLGARIQLLETRTKSVEMAISESAPAEHQEPIIPPPEFVAEMEERMLRQWIDEPIPALGGLTPREAVKTPEGREKVLELIEQSREMQRAASQVPGMFAPDYGKVKEMLDLD